MGDKSVWNLKLIYKWNPLSKFKRAGSYEVRESLIIPWKVSGSGRLELFMETVWGSEGPSNTISTAYSSPLKQSPVSSPFSSKM